MIKRIGVLISGGGTNLQALIDYMKENKLPAEISVVISNRKDAYGLERAEQSGIPAIFIGKSDFKDNDEFNRAILDKLKEYKVDLIVLAGYLSILNKEFVESYKNRIINVHPSLIPSFCGMGFYGSKVHKAVLEYGVKVTGATVHFVDENADTGPIILQKPVMVMPDDDVESLQRRVLKIEHELLPKAVELLVLNKVTVIGRKVIINDY